MTDLSAECRYARLMPDDVVTMVDVDAYLTDFSPYRGHHILFYTLAPNAMAGKTSDGSYYFETPSTVVEVVNGGAVYRQSIWDVSGDLCVVTGWFGFTQYEISKLRQPGANHRMIVYLAPKANVHMPWWLFKVYARFKGIDLTRSAPLARYSGAVEGANVIMGKFCGNEGYYNSIVRKSGPTDRSTKIPSHLWDTIVSARNSATTFFVADIQRLVHSEMPSANYRASDYRLLADAADLKYERNRLINFQAYGGQGMSHFEEVKPVAAVVAEPITTTLPYAAVASSNNELLCIEERVTKLSNKVSMPKHFWKYANEFVELLIPEAAIGVPFSLEQVKARQTRPGQVAKQLQEEIHLPRANRPKAFVKKEFTDKIAPAHNITTMDQSHLMLLSAYTYPLAEYLKKQHPRFYAPGKTPRQQVTMVTMYARDVSRRKGTVIETDFSRFDATRSEDLTKVEHMVYKRWCARDSLKELEKVLRGDYGQKVTTAKGHTYNSEFSRFSGSATTTVGNTIVNTFVAYVAYREAGRGPKQAFRSIGPKYGDDGLDEESGKFSEVVKKMGMSIKIVANGKHCTFLGRRYLDVFHFETTLSIPDKVLKRIPVTVHPKDPNCLANRVAGYMVTDSYVPIVGQYLAALKRIYGLNVPTSIDPSEDQEMAAILSDGAYPECHGEHWEQLLDCVGESLGLSASEVQGLDNRLKKAQSVEDIASIKLVLPDAEVPHFQFYLM